LRFLFACLANKKRKAVIRLFNINCPTALS
jgi:hypothetical protein